jgi:hypothetical protein
MNVALRQTSTGNVKFIETGWSWPIFLGAGFLGLPLFFRGMALWGCVMVFLWFLQFAVPFATVPNGDALGWILDFAILGICLYLGYKGNAMTARHLIACGYDFDRPDSSEARIAAERWGL